VIPAGVNLGEWFRFRASTRRLLAELRLEPEELVLLLPARLTRRKNVELALEVVAALRVRGQRPRLLVTGPPGPHDVRSGTYLDQLLQLRGALGVEQEVVFLYPHRLSDATIADLYQVADALLFPSAQEGFGIPLLEAGLARLPAFASDLPVFHEVAGDDAHYFALGDAPEAIAERLIHFVTTDLATRLRRRVRQHYTWDSIFPRLIEPLLQTPAGDPAADRRPSRAESP
jgi:glycosyltransferase involved in cell wall biosynthesis